MAVCDSSTVGRSSEFRFNQYFWGESVQGSKADIQSIGIGCGMAFPGEPDGPKRCLHTVDPRGFPVNITIWNEGVYWVSIDFPGRARPSYEAWIEYAPGVLKSSHLSYADEYVGTESALVAAKLVDPARFPGKPGMCKTRVRVTPDGAVLTGNKFGWRVAAMIVERRWKTRFLVRVNLSEEEESQREKEHSRRENEFQARINALPRPPSLLWLAAQSRPRNRDHLRLVWSKPDIRSLPFWR